MLCFGALIAVALWWSSQRVAELAAVRPKVASTGAATGREEVLDLSQCSIIRLEVPAGAGYDVITWKPMPGAVSYEIWRRDGQTWVVGNNSVKVVCVAPRGKP
jgi:hypothetical protein